MKAEDLTGELVGRAVDVYLSVAWGGREEEKRPDLGERLVGEEILGRLTDESKRDGTGVSRRYILRLGNRHYPHMKFVIEEYLLPGEFVFVVDTHDELDLKPDFPDYEAWQEIQGGNREIKRRIEKGWREGGIPTYSSLKALVEESGKRPRETQSSAKILVVDDERDIADAVASLLIAEGFEVLLAHDGIEAVETAIRERPDLILMDFQMPRMDGVEAAVRIRSAQSRRACRILLATASLVDLSKVGAADGFLLKPYSKEILISFIRALLKAQPREPRKR